MHFSETFTVILECANASLTLDSCHLNCCSCHQQIVNNFHNFGNFDELFIKKDSIDTDLKVKQVRPTLLDQTESYNFVCTS